MRNVTHTNARPATAQDVRSSSRSSPDRDRDQDDHDSGNDASDNPISGNNSDTDHVNDNRGIENINPPVEEEPNLVEAINNNDIRIAALEQRLEQQSEQNKQQRERNVQRVDSGLKQ